MHEDDLKDERPRLEADRSAEAASSRRTTRTWITAAFILLVGWTIAAVVYVTAAPPAAEDDLLYEWENSRRYQRELEQFGGKAVVFATELNRWFASLWEGRNLAFTIASLSAVSAVGYLVLALRRSHDDSEDAGVGRRP